jgi:Spy/CpxP family protein refolding chaperone
MRRLCSLTLAAGLFALAASPALAQPPGGGRGMGGPPSAAMLLGNKGVQDELKITDDQKSQIDKISSKYRDDIRAAFQSGDREKAADLRKKSDEEMTKALPDILKDDQVKRFKQIEVQVAGFNAFNKEDVQKALKLSDKQVKDYTTAKDDLDKDAKDLRDNAGRDRQKQQEARTKIDTMTKEATDKFMATFSDEQKKAYKDLTGDKFDYKPDFGGGRGGPGGAGGFGGGFGGPGRLLTNKSVQEELKISDDQKDKITKAGQDLAKSVPDILNKDQAARFKQIEVQVAGLGAFDQDDVKTALKLSDKQTKTIADVKDGLQKDRQDLFQSIGNDPQKRQDAMKKMQDLNKDALNKVFATFSDDQKKTWKDLAGDSFDYKPEFGGGRGAGGRGGNRPGGGTRPPRTPPTIN